MRRPESSVRLRLIGLGVQRLRVVCARDAKGLVQSHAQIARAVMVDDDPRTSKKVGVFVLARPLVISRLYRWFTRFDSYHAAREVAARLRRAGYSVVTTTSAQHALLVRVRASVRRERSAFQVKVNGRVKHGYTAHVRLELIDPRGHMLGSGRVSYDADERISKEDVSRLAAVVATPRVHALAERMATERAARLAAAERKAAAAEAKKRADQRDAARRAEAADDAAWESADAASCTTPTQPHACDGVAQYLAEYPKGKHVAPAKRVLAAGKPRIARIVDKRAWERASVSECESPAASTDCEGVRRYLRDHPEGLHAVEATQLLATSAPALAVLEKKEQRKACDEGATDACIQLGDQEKACELGDLESCIAAGEHARACEMDDVASCIQAGKRKKACDLGDAVTCDALCRGGDLAACDGANPEVALEMKQKLQLKKAKRDFPMLLTKCSRLIAKLKPLHARMLAHGRAGREEEYAKAHAEVTTLRNEIWDVRFSLKDAGRTIVSELEGTARRIKGKQLSAQYKARCPGES